MIKYVVGFGAVIVVVVGYFLFVSADSSPIAAPERVTDAVPAEPSPVVTPSAPDPVAVTVAESPTVDIEEGVLLEEMAAATRETLPEAVTDTLTLTDAVFLPRMRIMEFRYVTAAADGRAAASDMRALIEARAETICVDGREMFEMGVTLRSSFEDRERNVFQRVYLMPDDCKRFY